MSFRTLPYSYRYHENVLQPSPHSRTPPGDKDSTGTSGQTHGDNLHTDLHRYLCPSKYLTENCHKQTNRNRNILPKRYSSTVIVKLVSSIAPVLLTHTIQPTVDEVSEGPPIPQFHTFCLLHYEAT